MNKIIIYLQYSGSLWQMTDSDAGKLEGISWKDLEYGDAVFDNELNCVGEFVNFSESFSLDFVYLSPIIYPLSRELNA